MSVIKNIHHLTFVVENLDVAVSAYEEKLGLGPFQYDDLPGRGVSTARIRLAETWIVLVSPNTEDGEVARHLAAHGEGLLLMSFGVDDLDEAIASLVERGTGIGDTRNGLLDWQVADIESEPDLKVNCQLTKAG